MGKRSSVVAAMLEAAKRRWLDASRGSSRTTRAAGRSSAALARTAPSAPARDRLHDADLVAFLDRRVEVLQEADVLVVEVHVHETVELARRLEQPRLDAGGGALQRVQHFANVLTLRLNDVFAVRVVPQR